jgi:hypothetical protein
MEDRSKDKHIHKTRIIIYKFRSRIWNFSMELRERGKGKENARASVISHSIRYEGRGYRMCES